MTRVRALVDAVRVPGAELPYDTAHLRVHYPADSGDGDAAVGFVPAAGAALPVVLLANNFNCPPSLYHWLARSLASSGYAVVTWTWVAPLFGGRPGLSTGIDLSVVTPASFGSRVPSQLLPAVLSRLPSLDLPLDLSRVVLGGHSAGGTLALLCSSWLGAPAFSYGGHTRTQVPQGFGEDHVLPLGDGPPLLLLGGLEDGIPAAISAAQRGHDLPGHPMAVTAARAVPARRTCWTVLLEGANHYSFCEGYDGSFGRGHLEAPGSGDPAALRARIGELVLAFCDATLRGGPTSVLNAAVVTTEPPPAPR